MKLNAGLFQQQTQKQILSPQMIQSMEILALNQQQLDEKIAGELEENVALERDDAAASSSDSAAAEHNTSADLFSEGGADDAAGQQEISDLSERYDQLLELQAADFWSESSPVRKTAAGDDDDRFELIENTADRPATLYEHLFQQLGLRSGVDARQRALCEEIIYNLDDRGWLMHGLKDVFEAIIISGQRDGIDPRLADKNVSLSELNAALEQVQTLDLSRTLRELFALPQDPRQRGVSLAGALLRGDPWPDRPIRSGGRY